MIHSKKMVLIIAIATLLGWQTLLSAQKEIKLNTLAVKASERLLMDIKQVRNERLIAVGERGHILVSDDNGGNWTQKLVPSEALLTKLFFIDDKHGWAVGHQQTIIKTSDAGESWQVQHSSNDLNQPALFDVWFKDPLNGIAVGAYGLYLTTQNGGQTWQTVFQESLEDEEIGFPHFYSLTYEPANQKLLMAGELGFLALSNDFGQTWEKIPSPYHGSFFNIAALPDQSLLIMGLRGHLYRSTDMGKSWSELNTGTISGLQELTMLSDKKLLIVGSDGTLLISKDLGKSFRLVQRADRVHLANAIETQQNILLVGIDGVIKTKL
ncbi:WD40/YVTN/BNR-like repeat-containing protein [Aliikangiella sp. IMCC44359]|uniref:WD40/YVTN/BNR-like repeat-containing protein n=1 Tax=Aliikangiella sp. IMCC44359 TaxID=3459125 RepID=UPI00403B35D6